MGLKEKKTQERLEQEDKGKKTDLKMIMIEDLKKNKKYIQHKSSRKAV